MRKNNGPYLSDDPNDSGFYEIRWTENGRSKRKSTGEADPRRAQRVYAEFILALDGIEVAGSNITVAQVIDAYLAGKTDVMDCSVQTVTFGYLKAFFGDTAVADVDDNMAARYCEKRRAGRLTWDTPEGRTRGGRKAGDATLRRELLMLCAAVSWCIRRKKFRDQEGRDLLRPQDKLQLDLPQAPGPRDRWLTRKEALALLTACQPDPAAPLTRVYRYAAMMLYTASRREVVSSLPWERISLERGLIDFAEPGRRRTRKRRGVVPIADELRPILERAWMERTSDLYLDITTPPLKAFKAAVKQAGLSGVTPHVLRHTWATWAAQDGVSLFDIAGVLHDSLATVEKTYAHHCPEHLRNAVNRRLLAAE